MGTISKNFTFTSGEEIKATDHNSNFDTFYNAFNGGIENVNIGTTAGILDSQLAQIVSAGKVNFTAISTVGAVAGDTLWATSATSWAKLAIGTSGQALQSNMLATWERIYTNTLTVPATTIIIPDLNGDVDKEYVLKCRIVNGYNGSNMNLLRFNGDSASNYGYQELHGKDTANGASRNSFNGVYLSYTNLVTLGEIGNYSVKIYAKSGFTRTAIVETVGKVSGTTVTDIMLQGQSWDNSITNITSLTVLSDQTDGLGVGTTIELYTKRYL
jgi:hypothetical protein